jgi:aminoglycoside 6-adenylyltransferase
MKKRILDVIVNWANTQQYIKAIILEGSTTTGKPTDWLSDFDINVFVTDAKPYTNRNEWIYSFDDVIIYQKTSFNDYNYEIPTRLVVYKNSPRVDFAFYPFDVLTNEMLKELPDSYKNGYKVLLDKEGVSNKLSRPTGNGFIITKPTKDIFLKTIYDFWYEAYSVSKYLKRKRLWFSKHIENSYIKSFLKDMILWYESGKDDWKNNEIHQAGKNLELTISKHITNELPYCFSGYNLDDSWVSLFKMIDLFKRLSIDTAKMLTVEYPYQRVNQIEEYIKSIKERDL